MARRKQGIIEDVFEMCSRAPRWFGVAVAALFAIIGLFVSAGMSHNAIQNALRPLVNIKTSRVTS